MTPRGALPEVVRADVVVVGGGPAGLTAAAALRARGVDRVLVLDREREAGGIPRHADHQGYGLRDLHRSLPGPVYARRLVDRALAAGVGLDTGAQVTGWTDDEPLGLWVTSPLGRRRVVAAAVVLATGCRERPRSARLVPGARPAGIMTTGTLQQLVHLERRPVGRHAVVVGAEHVSFSALLTLAHAGTRAVAMVTDHPHHQSYALFRAGAAARFRVPLLTGSSVTAIHGRGRVTGVDVTHAASGTTRTLSCDSVVFTADWIPDHELTVLGGARTDPGTRGPAVDGALRTSRPGVFAAGNVLHGAESADVAALTGRHAAGGVVEWLAGGRWPAAPVPVVCEHPLDWVVPNVITAEGDASAARGRALLRAHHELLDVHLAATQDGHALWSGRVPRVMPGRSARLPADWATGADPGGGPVHLRVLRARSRRPGR